MSESVVSLASIEAARERARRHQRWISRVLDRVFRRPLPMVPGCMHENVVEVESLGEVVSGLCLGCSERLPAEWFTCDHAEAKSLYVDSKVIREPEFGYSERLAVVRCPSCEVTWWKTVEIADWVRWL